MARPLRIELADGYYHVMNRGNNRQDIFLSDKDRKAFMEALADSCEIYKKRDGVDLLRLTMRFYLGVRHQASGVRPWISI
jgi:REP element-mobilizing transposase RayT